MTDHKEMQLNPTEIELNNFNHPAWGEPIICRVEVDLPGWLTQLAGGHNWEVYSEDEDENCISFSLRELQNRAKDNFGNNAQVSKLAEVTLYHNGYAVVDVDGKALFDGTLTNGASECAHLSYFHADSGEPITLN
jgi:hypothetical protein